MKTERSWLDTKGALAPARYCGAKVAYDKRGAQTARNKRMEEDGIELRIYPCPRCGSWHLTHLVERQKT